MAREDLLSKEEAKAVRSSSEIAKLIHTRLKNLSKTNKIQLLEYEWQILPVELIKITIITDRNNQEFTYGH
jgi:hypothetical protein